MYVLYLGVVRHIVAHETQHLAVDLLRAETSPAGEDNAAVLTLVPERAQRLFAAYLAELRTQRVSDTHRLFGVMQTLKRRLKVDIYPVNVRFKYLNCCPWARVRLMQRGGDAHLACRLHYRPANISARAENKVGLEELEQLSSLAVRLYHKRGGAQIFERQTALKPAYINMVQPISRRGNYLIFDAARRADKGNIRVRLLFFYLIRYGDSGINVTSRSAACH